MKTRVCRSRWLPLVGLLFVGAAVASPAKSVRVTSYAEFAEGQAQGVLISSLGDVRPGYSQNRLPLPSLTLDSVRALATAADGTVWLGAGGDKPTLLRYRPGAALTAVVSLPAATWVTAIVAESGGRLLVATAGDGRLFRLQPDGKVETVAQIDAEHIWGLARDEARGVTYVAAAPGRLWAIDDRDLATLPNQEGSPRPPSKARKLFESDARQFLALHRGEDGGLYVGTADDAVLYRIDPAGGGRAIHDFAGNEVRAIVQHGGSLYVAVNDMQRGDAAAKATPTKITPAPAGSVPGVKAPAPPGSPTNSSPVDKKGKGALYRIDPSGRIEQLHAIVDGFFNALAVDAQGVVYAAASTPGGRGRLYGVTPDRTVFTALEVKESDLLTLLAAPSPAAAAREASGGLFVGTGNAGAFYVVRPQPPADAQYLSKAFAAPAPSRWGRLRYLAEGRVRIETRSGNLAKPDASWSPWQPLGEPLTQPSTGEQTGRIASPAARYLQVRAALPERSVLRDFSFYHQPLNQRPRITEVTVGEDGTGRIARGVRPPSPQRPRSPLIKIRWKTENPDEDELNYRLYLRPAKPASVSPSPAPTTSPSPAAPPASSDEGEWLRLGGPDALTRTELEWNTEAVGDGLYELKVVVSDERSNPPELALTHEHITPPFTIDNRRPEIRDLTWNAATLTLSGRVSDATSPIAELSYSIDGGELLPVAVRDGVLDDLSEEFSLRPPRLTAGSHTLVVRASDGADNLAAAQIIIPVSPAALAKPAP